MRCVIIQARCELHVENMKTLCSIQVIINPLYLCSDILFQKEENGVGVDKNCFATGDYRTEIVLTLTLAGTLVLVFIW